MRNAAGGDSGGVPRWVKWLGILAIVLVVLFVILILLGHTPPPHGP